MQKGCLGLFHRFIAVFLACLVAIGRLVACHGLGFEHLKLLLIAHNLIPFLTSDGVLHRADETVQLRLPRPQAIQVTAQGGQPVEGGIVQTFPDSGELHPEGPIVEDVPQPVHLGWSVVAVAGFRDTCGLEQTDLVVPAQGAGGHPGQARQFLNGIFHADPSSAPIVASAVTARSRAFFKLLSPSGPCPSQYSRAVPACKFSCKTAASGVGYK